MSNLLWRHIPLYTEAKHSISWHALIWLKYRLRSQKLLMDKSTIEPNGLHYPDEWTEDGIVRIINGTLEPSPCYFAGCVPNEPCKVEAYEKHCAEQYEPTNLDDLVY